MSKQSFLTIEEFSRQTGWSRHKVAELAASRADPLPVRYIGKRGGVIIADEAAEWLQRNGVLACDRI